MQVIGRAAAVLRMQGRVEATHDVALDPVMKRIHNYAGAADIHVRRDLVAAMFPMRPGCEPIVFLGHHRT
jgi:hypothetical protein